MTLPGDEAAFAALFERHRRELQVAVAGLVLRLREERIPCATAAW